MFRLVFQLSADAAQAIPLPDAQTLTLGRGDDNSIRLEHATVSRRHARLRGKPDGGWLVEDLQSRNGVRLNGVRLKRAEALREGDQLVFGDVAATFRQATPGERSDDAAHDAVAAPTLGRTFAARYRLQSAQGGTSAYDGFRALDLQNADRPVAMKIFKPGAIEAGGGFEPMSTRFAALQAAPAPPNLAVLLDFACWNETCYLVTGWTEGFPLPEVLHRPRKPTAPEILRFARQAATVTTHARAHRLPPPDLDPRTMLVVFDPPLPRPEAWTKLLDKPIERWPAFRLVLCPSLGLPEPGYPFGALLVELLGAAPATMVPGARPAPVQVPGLGERGHEVLARGLASRGEAFGGDAAFVETLLRASDPRGYH